jgi:Nuclease-related domain/AAA domain
MTRGEDAERRVEERLRDALPVEYHVYPNVAWTGPMRDRGPAEDGEADLVIAHPDRGILVLEVKAGEPSRDAQGRWWLGPIELDRSPFEQAMRSQHQLVRKLVSLPGWPSERGADRHAEPHAGHGVAFPDVDVASLPRGHVLLGPDAPREIVLDAEALETPERSLAWVERAYAYFTGDGARGWPLEGTGMHLLDELLSPTLAMHRLVRGRIADDRAELLLASREQELVLNRARSRRRVEVVGPAGSGKSMLAAEKARRLAREGYRTLLVCFNQRLATTVMRDLADAPAPGGLEVTTFHRLCERLGTEAGVLPTRPTPIPPAWWDETLPTALEAAIDALPRERYHAIVVDEGQDFARGWLETLDFLLRSPGEDTLWVFHDPGQALYRDDVVGELGLERLELHENWRNPASVAALASRFYTGGEEISAYREGGVRHRVIEASPGPAALDELRRALHELTEVERVPPWEIVVLVRGLSRQERRVANPALRQRRPLERSDQRRRHLEGPPAGAGSR